MGVDDHEQRAHATHSERGETLLPNGILVFAGQRVLIYQYRGRFGERNAVRSQVRLCFPSIPLDPTRSSSYQMYGQTSSDSMAERLVLAAILFTYV